MYLLKPYEKLAEVYDKDWGSFSLGYVNIIEHLKEKYDLKINSILDITCGTGVLINELSKSYDVAGSDISPYMINAARKKFPSIEFHVSDMAELRLDKKFDLILSTFDSVNYLLDITHFKKALLNIKRLLNKPGYFLFDFNTDVSYKEKHKGIIEREADDTKYKQVLKYYEDKRLALTIFDFGDAINESHIQRAYNYSEITSLLGNYNFTIIYSNDMSGKDKVVDEQTQRALILAHK